MIITEQMRRALHTYILENCLTAKDLALKIDVAHVTPARWLSGRVTSMHPHTWKKLEPMLRPYLKEKNNADDYADALVDDHYHNQENWGADVAGLDKEIDSIWEKIHTQLDEIHNVLKKNNVRHDIQYLEEELLKPLRKRIDERTRRIDEAFSKQYEGINETAQILSGDLGEERKTLLEYLYRKSNNLKRYELLAEIEREKTQETLVKYSISRAPQGLKAAEKRSKYKDKLK